MSRDKKLKVGVKKGAGLRPGYRWSVLILDRAFDEAMSFLNESQYQHLAMQVKELAFSENPPVSTTVDVRPVENVYEIRDKGGPLGGMNVRICFGVDKPTRSLVVLGAIRKQNDGPTPLGDKVTMRRRWRAYVKGEYGEVLP